MNPFERSPKIIVERPKVVNYLLNLAHQDGFGKAKILIQHGFHPDRWEEFAEMVVAHARDAQVVEEIETQYGTKIVLEGNLRTPAGKFLRIKSIWILNQKDPILVTLYPN